MNDPFSTHLKVRKTSFEQMVWDVAHSFNAQVICSMKQSIWLYLSLLLQAHRITGTVKLDPKKTAEAMGVKEATIRSWLGHLRKAGYVSIKRWPGSLLVKLSRFKPPSAMIKDSFDEPGAETERSSSRPALPDADKAFAQALAQALNDEDNLTQYEEAVRQHDHATLTRALEQVQRVPAERITKSRSALFHYILKRNK